MLSELFLSISMKIRRMNSIMMTSLNSYPKTLTEARSALHSTIIRDIFSILRVSATLKTDLLKELKHCNCTKYQQGSLALISIITQLTLRQNRILRLKWNHISWQDFPILQWIWIKLSRTKTFMKRKCQKMYILE